MREPDAWSEWQQWDEEQAAGDVRHAARAARTEDEYLDALRDAGSLGAGIAAVAAHPPARPTYRDHELALALEEAALTCRRRQDAYAAALRAALADGKTDDEAHRAGLDAERAVVREMKGKA
jgi:hypothetical protein